MGLGLKLFKIYSHLLNINFLKQNLRHLKKKIKLNPIIFIFCSGLKGTKIQSYCGLLIVNIAQMVIHKIFGICKT